MANQINLTVFDGAATPVSHTLEACGIQPSPAGTTVLLWREDKAGVPRIGQVTLTLTQSKSAKGVFKNDFRWRVPVLETAGTGGNVGGYVAQPAVAYTLEGGSYFMSPERASTAENRLIRQLVANLAGGVSVSVVPVTTGNVAEAVDKCFNLV